VTRAGPPPAGGWSRQPAVQTAGRRAEAVAEWPLFLSCAAGCEAMLAEEVAALTGRPVQAGRAGVATQGDASTVMRLNLGSRLAQRVLIRLHDGPYRDEQDLYAAAQALPWEDWFGPDQPFRVDLSAQRSPLRSLNFAVLRVKDAVADRFRAGFGRRPDVDTHQPDARIHLHLGADRFSLSIDTSGEPLFKRGWRDDTGAAPLKETLAAALLVASGWAGPAGHGGAAAAGVPLWDPCCGSGTIVIEAAQIACGIAPGLLRRFAFERLLPFDAATWRRLRDQARAAVHAPTAPVHGSDVAHRMVDFARRNAERAGVGHAVALRGGDALDRRPPEGRPGVIVINPPYGERIAVGGVAAAGPARSAPASGAGRRQAASQAPAGPSVARGHQRSAAEALAREHALTPNDGEAFFERLAAHWKRHAAGWVAWVLTPDAGLPGRMRLKATRRVPLWNGPIECRLFRFDLQARQPRTTDPA